MKRTIITFFVSLIFCMAKSQDMSNSIEYNQVYIVGAATASGWSETNAPEMTKIDHGVFEWTGELKGGEDFKFLNTRSWYKNILSAIPDPMVELGKSYNLDFYAAWDLNGKDWKFKMPETGIYKITVDLRNMKMSVTASSEKAEIPEKLYVTGSALNNQIVELDNMYDAEFKKTVSCTPGNIFLINTADINENTIYYGPKYEDVDVTFGKGFNAEICIADKGSRGWSVGTKGDYTFYIRKSDFTHQGRKYVPRKVLYLVGGCCELNWNYWDESNKRFRPNPDKPEELIWEGELRIGTQEEPNSFKILTTESWTEETFHPYIAYQLAEGVSDARISGGDDLKWTIEKDGYYRLTLNTKTEKLVSEYLGQSDGNRNNADRFGGELSVASSGEAQPSSVEVRVHNRIIFVNSLEKINVTVCDLSGSVISHIENHTNGAVSDTLASGVYIVSTNHQKMKILVE